MKQALKQRVVGGIVLGSLLLIIIPMVVDFSHQEPSPLESVTIPPGPDVMKMEVLPLGEWSEKVDPEINPRQKIIETATPKAKKPVTEAVKKTDPVAHPKPKSKSKPETAANASVWAVQVASFTNESKALTLRDKLRDLGHASFVERGSKPSGNVIYRVKVGPVLQRSRADELKKQVKADVKLDGLVIRHR